VFLQNDYNLFLVLYWRRDIFIRVPDNFIKIASCTRVDLLNRKRGESRAYSIASLAVKIMRRRDRHASLQPHVQIINVTFFYSYCKASVDARIFLYNDKVETTYKRLNNDITKEIIVKVSKNRLNEKQCSKLYLFQEAFNVIVKNCYFTNKKIK